MEHNIEYSTHLPQIWLFLQCFIRNKWALNSLLAFPNGFSQILWSMSYNVARKVFSIDHFRPTIEFALSYDDPQRSVLVWHCQWTECSTKKAKWTSEILPDTPRCGFRLPCTESGLSISSEASSSISCGMGRTWTSQLTIATVLMWTTTGRTDIFMENMGDVYVKPTLD